MRVPMPLVEQIEVLRLYLRTLQADIRRASREQNLVWRKRRVSPYVESLRWRRLSAAHELHEAAEECLKQLKRARALAIAEFAPGDVVQVTIQRVPPRPARPERFVIVDVLPSKRLDDYHYEVWQLTTSGRLFQRGTTWLSRSRAVTIERFEGSLPSETLETCDRFRRGATAFVQEARDKGQLEPILKLIQERRARRGW